MREGKWLAFSVGEHRYCVEAEFVREVRTLEARLIPERQGFALGRFRLRDGAELDLIDLNARLGAGATTLGERMIVIVLAARRDLVGFPIDDGVELIDAEATPAPESPSVDERFILGAIAWGDTRALWLDVDRVGSKRATLSAIASSPCSA